MRVEELLGIPYKYQGRDLNGFDCYGFVKYCYKEFLKVDLPEYFGYKENWYDDGENVLCDKMNQFSSLWIKVEVPIKWDILTFNHNMNNVTNHCALYLGNDKIIHTYNDTPVVIDRLSHKYWNSRLNSVVRYISDKN